MSDNFYKILEFPSFKSKNGVLTMFEAGNSADLTKLPFNLKRVLVIKGMKNNDARGGHTHHKTRQLLLAVSGGCTVDLDNGKTKVSVKLIKHNQALLLEPYVWHVMRNFKANTMLLVLANRNYDEKDYIRSYEDFLKYVK